MLDYPTCLKLKEAGFPQEGNGSYINDEGLGDMDHYSHWLPYDPTLEELIEECPKLYNGQVFDLCYLPNGVWTAWYEAPNEEIRPSKEGLGKTPIEAVANLWLALAKSN